MHTDISALLQQCLSIVERRVAALDKKKVFTDTDARILSEYIKILMSIEKNNQDVEEELKKLIAKLPTDQLQKMNQ